MRPEIIKEPGSIMKNKIVELPLDDYLCIKNLHRRDLDQLEPKVDITNRAKQLKIQLYILEDATPTIYGCFVDDENKIYWFGYHINKDGNIVPDAEYSLSDLMATCDPGVISPLLYHLDTLS